MKSVRLVAINARYSHTNLAVLYMRETIRDLPWVCDVKSFTINTPFYDILEGLSEDMPDVLAFSVYIWNAELMKRLLPEIKKIMPQTKLILGGPEVSYNHQQWIQQFPDIDYIVVGAGEKGFRELLENDLTFDKQIVDIGALPYDQIPFPYIPEDFEESRNKILYYESSRGCPFKCTFCLSSRDDQKLDYRHLERIHNELKMIVDQKPGLVKFVDRSFNAKAKMSREIWRYLIDLNPSTRFHFELHPLLLKDEDFELLATAPEGLFQFEIGIQTLNEQSQEVIRRKNRWHKMRPNIERLIALGNIHIHVDFIAGLPHEDMASTKASFNGIYELKADVMQFGFLKVIPGTPMYYQIEELGLKYTQSAPYQILETKWLNFDELRQLREMETSLNAIYNCEQFKVTEAELIQLHDNPFDAYKAIAEFAKANALLSTKSWNKVAQWIIDYVKSKFPEKASLIYDCLRYDWVQIPKSRTYPPFLLNGQTEEHNHLKKNLRELFRSNDLKLADKVFKSGIIFKPSTTDFISNYKVELSYWVDENGQRKKYDLHQAAIIKIVR